MELISFFLDFDNCIFTKLSTFCESINDCTNLKSSPDFKGHPLVCHANPLLCKSRFLKLLIVRAHFPEMRTIEKLIYKLLRLNKQLFEIQNALSNSDKDKLFEIYKNSEIRKLQSVTANKNDLNEAYLKKKYKRGYALFMMKNSDLPILHCISCERLRRQSDLRKLDNYRYKIDNEPWKELMNKYVTDEINGDFICKSCSKAFSKGKIPFFSIF